MNLSSATLNSSIPQLRGLPGNLAPVAWWLERLPVVVLAVSVVFLQGFAMRFWEGLLGTSGWGVSLGLEILHLWFWYRAAISARFARFGWIAFAVVATALLLAGALHEVTRPLLQESARIVATDQERRSLESEAQVLTANLAAYRAMAAGQGRRGWQADIRRDTARLQAITDQLRTLNGNAENNSRFPWLNRITQAGVVAVAVLFQVAAVLAVWSISGNRYCRSVSLRGQNTVSRSNKTVSDSVSERGVTFRAPSKSHDPAFYRQIWRGVESHAKAQKARLARGNGRLSQAALARDLGINPPDLSGIKLLAHGQKVPRNPSRVAVTRLAKQFSVAVPK